MGFTPDLLFIYGSLLDSSNKYGAYLKTLSLFKCTGKLRGILYDLGTYPGAVADPECGNYITGSVMQLVRPQESLKFIDDYEGFGPEQTQPNEFIRTIENIETDTGILSCWVYLYNLPVVGYSRIISGDFKTG